MKLTVNHYFPEWDSGGGIFSALQSLGGVPWEGENISMELDTVFHGNYAGEKIASPLVRNISGYEPLTSDQKQRIAKVVLSIFGRNWQKEFDTLSYEYSPLNNYDMTETEQETRTTDFGRVVSNDGETTNKKTGTDTRTPNLTERETPDLETNINTGIYAFNSSALSDTGEQTQVTTGESERVETGTEEMTYNTTETVNTGNTETNSGSDTGTVDRSLTRSGNIGVTTSQQMLQSERDVWLWNFFNDVVFPNVSNILALKVY